MRGDAPLAFHYHRAVAPMLWALVALGTIELVVVHGLIAVWSLEAAVALSVLSLAGIGWIVALIRSMKRLPVLLGPETLVMRVGFFRRVEVPIANLAGLRPEWDMAALKARTILNLALVAYPNIVLDLRRPLPGGRGVLAIAHRLDDPAGFAAALGRLGVPA